MLKHIQKRIVFSVLLLAVIGFIDYFINAVISTAIFYTIPILIFAYQNTFRLRYSILFAVTGWALWSWIDYHTHPYSASIFLITNHILRAGFAVLAAVVSNRLFRENMQQRIINEQKESLEKANAELNKFVGMAAHDIRNPVGAIQMTTEMMLEDETLNAETKEFLEMIHSAASNSLLILNDTLNISKIQSGTIELKQTEYEYIQFVKECIAQNKHLAENKKQSISLITEIPALMMVFDKSRLSQVMNNLLTNAIKYSEKHKAITVKISYADAEQKELLTEVIDNGLGIDEKFHATLFDPFTTTSNMPTANESKTGLGLSIVKKIVELHKGTIGFRSEKGKGSDFFFSLPV